MGRQIPKNVRQIGNVSDSPKIYVEDYVDTFLLQMCDKAKEQSVGAFLIGDVEKTEGEDYVYIYGAVQMQELKQSGNEYIIDEQTWKRAYEDCKQYFEDGEMLGWFVTGPGIKLGTDKAMIKLHKKSFPKQNTVFIIKESVEKEEVYFVHKLNDLIELGGHYTYYEKNPCMQNYMISVRRKNGVSPSENVEDRAAKDFRNMVRSREMKMQRKNNRFVYAVSSILVLIVVIMGITTLNNFDKMKSVQDTLKYLADNSKQETSKQIVETNAALDEGQAEEQMEVPKEETPTEPTQSSATNDTTEQGEGSEESFGDGIYEVQQGDTLATISRKAYGDVSHVESICQMNGITDGNLIYVGQKLLLP